MQEDCWITDDHQLYLAFQPIDQDSDDVFVNKIQRCMAEVKQWMVHNMLQLNDDKTEFIVIGTKQQRNNIDIPHINIIGPTTTVRNLGVMFDRFGSSKYSWITTHITVTS